MQISKLRIRNYKSFRDSGWLDFSSHFTIIIGQNNVGKTALLECFRLRLLQSHKPHRSRKTSSRAPLDPTTRIDLELRLTGEELLHSQLTHGGAAWIPVPSALIGDEQKAFAQSIYEKAALNLALQARPGEVLTATRYPSHGLFTKASPQHCIYGSPNQNKQSIDIQPAPSVSEADGLPSIADQSFAESIYVFRAERLAIGRTTAGGTTILLPDASNLAVVLMALQGNAHRFDRFNKHVTEIFPSITRVSVATVGNEFEIRIWSIDIATEREDLAIPLSESGTGVGQVLAILYVAITIERGLIVIDEPNTFLHPGAAKKLIQILKQYEQHQYVIATHSGDLVATADPEIIQLVTWSEGESSVQAIDKSKLDDLRRILLEVGASFSDVFGFDRAIWVEGPTEEVCFPMILRKLRGTTPLGVAFLAVKNTGDFERKTKGDQKKLIWDLYGRLSSGFALLPAAVTFSFDRESRTDQQIDDLKRESRGRVHFLPRLTYENYLLHPDAIAAVLTDLPREEQGPVTAEMVTEWIKANGGRFAQSKDWSGEIDEAQWLATVHSPSLLSSLFDELSGTNFEYSKTTHSVLITEWLLEHRPAALSELAAYIDTLSPHKSGVTAQSYDARNPPSAASTCPTA